MLSYYYSPFMTSDSRHFPGDQHLQLKCFYHEKVASPTLTFALIKWGKVFFRNASITRICGLVNIYWKPVTTASYSET